MHHLHYPSHLLLAATYITYIGRSGAISWSISHKQKQQKQQQNPPCFSTSTRSSKYACSDIKNKSLQANPQTQPLEFTSDWPSSILSPGSYLDSNSQNQKRSFEAAVGSLQVRSGYKVDFSLLSLLIDIYKTWKMSLGPVRALPAPRWRGLCKKWAKKADFRLARSRL